MNNIQKYNQAFINILEIDKTQVNEGLALGVTREWDSIAHIGLISEMEELFDVSIDYDVLTEFNTYEAGMKLLEGLGVDFSND
ncbi:acyl carrier protein [Jeotgalibacillus aurantiacus]|uniref:acyl carrier protein n=1 Tax=Jeotgalibacillus aurantiacus TaxID=2763266 RepID=UPI001D0BA90E|nr:acyl carrier protein [Jeotgalibacillus aurantiacus]